MVLQQWKKSLFYLATTNKILSVLLSAGVYIHQSPLQSQIRSTCSSGSCGLAPIHSPYFPEWVSEQKTVVLKTILASRLCLRVSASFCGFVGVCVCLLFLFMGPNPGSGLKLAVAADRYVRSRGSGVPRSWTQAAVTVLWAAIVICGRTFWRAARRQKSRVLLSS